MRKTLQYLLIVVLLYTLAISAIAAPAEPEITFEPQNPNYPEYSTASYTVKVEGTNLHATWWMEWEGQTYNISDTSSSVQPWEGYAGETYGAVEPSPGEFTYFFGGIGHELNGARIWCVVEDGHYEVVSQKAMISIGNPSDPPVIEQIPAKVVVEQGETVDVRCVALAPGDTQLSYVWYETDTGHLEDIRAMDRGEEVSDFITPDTSTIGVRFYVCMVRTNEGGIAYSGVVPVYVVEKQVQTQAPTTPSEAPTEPEETETTQAPTIEETEPTVITATGEEATTQATEPKETEKEKSPKDGEDEEESKIVQWLLPVCIGVVAAGAGIGIGIIITKKKK